MPSSERPSKYPSVDAYVATLPEGWASFADCRVNGGLLVGLREAGAFAGLEGLPSPVAEGIASAAGGLWIPEALSVGAFLAVRDARFRGPAGEVEFLAWVDALNHGILRTEETLREAKTAGDAVRSMPGVWAQFHRGTTLTVLTQTKSSAELAFAHPPFLFPTTWMEVRRRTLSFALARAGAAQPNVRARPDGDRGTLFDVSWT